MHRFEFLPHTADIRMLVEASTIQELFEAALEGMNAVLHPDDISDPDQQTYNLQISSLDTTSLLIDFLSDVLTTEYERKTIFNFIEIHQLTEKNIEAGLLGSKIKHFAEDIKAVTYHEANVHQNAKGNWETVVIFDI